MRAFPERSRSTRNRAERSGASCLTQAVLIQHRTPRLRPRAGLSLVELLIAFTVIMVALGGTLGAITSTASVGGTNRESTVAYQAARQMLERLRDEDFRLVFARYNADASDDPVGGAPGMHFAVPGLDLQAGDADGFAGRVLFANAGPELFEDTDAPAFDLPLDLNADGVIDGDNHVGDAVILPVRVRVEWSGQSGDRVVEYGILLGRRD